VTHDPPLHAGDGHLRDDRAQAAPAATTVPLGLFHGLPLVQLVGDGILSRFVITLDYPRGRLSLSPTTGF